MAHLQLAARDEAVVTLPADSKLAPTEAVFQGLSLIAREEFPYDEAQAEILLGKLIDLLIRRGGHLGTVLKP